VRIENRRRVALLILDRQSKGDAISREMLVELGSATVEIESDRGVRAAVLTGAGTRFFCTGADLRMERNGRCRIRAALDSRRAFPV
jgi:enoyl-CoA hydratase/carnithine racemase